MPTTVPALPGEVCAFDPERTLPDEVVIYDTNAPAFIPRRMLRVVCNEECAQALTDSYLET